MSLLTDENAVYLFGGYVAFWLLVLGYWWSLRRREQAVHRELTLWSEEE